MGVWGKMKTVDKSETERLRALEAQRTLQLLAEHVKVDKDFQPTESMSTKRVHVFAAGADWEFLVNGPKFYDTRAHLGGGGAIDLVMHLWKVPFRQAIVMLREAGA